MNRITSSLEAIRADDLHSSEEQFRRSHPVFWAATLYGPFLLTALLLTLLTIYTGWAFTFRVVTSVAVALLVLGRFIILSGTSGEFSDTNGALASEHLYAIVCYLDVMAAIVLAFHIGFLFRLPIVGTRIAALVTDGHFVLDAHPWIRKATFFGLIAFVGFPLAATGSVGGSIFGRLLGMSRFATFCGILIGALLGNTIMFYFSDLLGEWIDKDNPWIKFGGLGLILVLVVILERRYRQLRDRFADETQKVRPLPAVEKGTSMPGGDHRPPTDPQDIQSQDIARNDNGEQATVPQSRPMSSSHFE